MCSSDLQRLLEANADGNGLVILLLDLHLLGPHGLNDVLSALQQRRRVVLNEFFLPLGDVFADRLHPGFLALDLLGVPGRKSGVWGKW